MLFKIANKGHKYAGGDGIVRESIKRVTSNRAAFAAVTLRSGVVAWGNSLFGGENLAEFVRLLTFVVYQYMYYYNTSIYT